MPYLDDTNTVAINVGSLNSGDTATGTETPALAEEKTGRFDCSLESLSRKPQARYDLIRSIGFGGMKCVLLVHDRDTGREIAMALMPDFKERPRCP